MATKNVLLTGGTGFIGRGVRAALAGRCNLSAPTRAELDLQDAAAVSAFLANGRFDAVVHLANPTGYNPLDPAGELFERSLRAFAALARCAGLYGKMVYIGSGAEYGKHRDLSRVREEAFGDELPRDGYGLSRYIMNELCAKAGNIVNLRLFACHGPGDAAHKLLPRALSLIRAGQPLALRQDALFDFLYVEDVAPVLIHFIENPARHRAYNLCSGERLWVSRIVGELQRQAGSDLPVSFAEGGPGFEYTGDNTRLQAEMPEWRPTAMREAIRRILAYEHWQACNRRRPDVCRRGNRHQP